MQHMQPTIWNPTLTQGLTWRKLHQQSLKKKKYQREPQTDVEIFNYIVHANQGTQSGRQVWETSVGYKW